MLRLFFTVLMLTISLTCHAGWTTPANVSNNSDGSRSPALAVDYTNNNGYGKAHIVWTEVDGDGNWHTYYRIIVNPSSLSTTTNVGYDINYDRYSTQSTTPHIFIDQTIADTSVKPDITYMHRNNALMGGVEHSEALYLPEARAYWPLGDGEGEETDDEYVQCLHHVSGLQTHVMTPFIHLDACMQDQILFWSQHDYGGHPDHDVFCNYQYTNMYELRDWQRSDITYNTASGDSCFYPYADSFVYGENYELHVVSYDFAGRDHLIHNKYIGDSDDCSGTWSSTNIASTSDSYNPSCKIRPSNHYLYIAYYHDDGDGTSEYRLLIWNGSTYSSSKIADGTDPAVYKVRPVIDFDSSSNLYVVYIDQDLNVMVRKLTSGGVWQTPTRVDNQNNRDHSWVHLDIDPRSNKPHVVYDEMLTSTRWDIFWSRYE